jgi:hypothetical protein
MWNPKREVIAVINEQATNKGKYQLKSSGLELQFLQ